MVNSHAADVIVVIARSCYEIQFLIDAYSLSSSYSYCRHLLATWKWIRVHNIKTTVWSIISTMFCWPCEVVTCDQHAARKPHFSRVNCVTLDQCVCLSVCQGPRYCVKILTAMTQMECTCIEKTNELTNGICALYSNWTTTVFCVGFRGCCRQEAAVVVGGRLSDLNDIVTWQY